MAKRRRSKKWKKKVMKSLTMLVVLLIIGVISMILQPWQYLDGGQGGDKGSVGDRTEANVTDLQVHYIDVGQADSILIRVPTENGTKNMLIDAGTEGPSSDKIVTDYLNSLGIDTLTYMVFHLDKWNLDLVHIAY